ncbi:hypothetical protein AVEN_265673-1 [Araneus ventricosus]|uniref:Uncharacterized protein n=1 Tax=Araneus ventricosus TaxID=182803 RepID=A0A4Y2RDA4_ARAVE|nr:hypothetical protein AVEN_93029-1 [Araneus ventricosus]GBN73693.1 hypothetical protein AVEN_265673-1 [Araneus ventricosus]
MLEKRRPSRTPLRRGNKKKPAGARSGEYGGCSRNVTLRVARNCPTRMAVCGRALSWSSFHWPLWYNWDALQLPFQNSLVEFRVDGCTREYKFMMDQALTVEKGGQQRLNPGFGQMTFFGRGDDEEHHSMDCRLVSGSYW